jgi:hypothetical protein
MEAATSDRLQSGSLGRPPTTSTPTPEEFFQRGEEAFQIWWSELDPPESSRGLILEYEAARAVWLATYEQSYASTLISRCEVVVVSADETK